MSDDACPSGQPHQLFLTCSLCGHEMEERFYTRAEVLALMQRASVVGRDRVVAHVTARIGDNAGTVLHLSVSCPPPDLAALLDEETGRERVQAR